MYMDRLKIIIKYFSQNHVYVSAYNMILEIMMH